MVGCRDVGFQGGAVVEEAWNLEEASCQSSGLHSHTRPPLAVAVGHVQWRGVNIEPHGCLVHSCYFVITWK